ncbi:MAG: NAD(P)/FAD-dependent oxidoreductase [Bacillota bacterium]|nr:NAD(P)/FAD-dependent oxidoreductase [Bacillota bacterium]
MFDILIIGAGVTGCSIAKRLGQYKGKMAVLDLADDVSQGASKANSGIVHAGYDAKPGTQKARLNVKGAGMMKDLCESLGVPYGQPGALVLGFHEEDRQTLEALYQSSLINEVPGCRLIDRDEVLRLEPNVNKDVLCALDVPTSGLVSPYELTHALADSAKENGVDFLLNHEVKALEYQDGAWLVHTSKGVLKTRAVINCAGTFAGVLHNQISTRKVKIIPRRGQYYLLDRMQPLLFTRTLFQVPTKMGKGVLVSPTTHGNLLLGPTAEDIEDGFDTATTAEGLDDILDKVRLTYPEVSLRQVITTFSGIRAHETGGDFIIGAVEGAPEGAFEAIGIESPGLSAAPAIGEELGDWVAYSLGLEKNPNHIPPTPLPKPFSAMSEKERRAAYENDPDYGRIVCRCEQVTEAEIRQAIRRPQGARTLDGVKRRTRAGMGRCQSGFCSTRVMQILSEELGLPLDMITKSGQGSELIVGQIGEKNDE